MAACLALGHDAMLRTSEILQVCRADWIDSGAHCTLLLHDTKTFLRTGVRESLPITDRCVLRLVRHAFKDSPPGERLWRGSAAAFREGFKAL
eukprot:1077058-Amphidinium_carterae.1